MKRILAQCSKELAQFRRDRLTMALAFVLPLAMLMIYGFAIRLETKNIPLSVQDFDNSPLSRSYVERLYATQQFIPTPNLSLAPTETINQGIAKATVIIPPDFSEKIINLQPIKIQVLVDGTDVNNARVIQNSIRATTHFFVSTIQDIPPSNIIARIRLWFNPGRSEALYIVPGIYGVILWVFPSMLASIAMVREKERGTIIQVYASNLTAFEWLLGKEIAYLLVGMGETLFLVTASFLLFGVHLVIEPSSFIVGTLIFLAAAVAFGLFVGVKSSNQSAAVQGTAIGGFLTAFLLSGFIYRIENIPFPLSLFCNIIPARYYIILTRDSFIRGTGWLGVWYIPIIIGCIGCFLFLVATRSIHRMQLSD